MSERSHDIVFVHGLRVDALIGVHAWERELRQTLLIDLDLAADVRAGAARDVLEDALDYQALARRVGEFVRGSSYQLVESLAEALASRLIEEFAIPWLRLRITKPGAVPGAAAVGVLIERSVRG
jgi:dihydroneopterin aldolase